MLFDGGGSGLAIGIEATLARDVLLLANVSVADTPTCNLTVGIMIQMFIPLGQDEYLFPIFTNGFTAENLRNSRIAAVSVYPPQPGEDQYNII